MIAHKNKYKANYQYAVYITAGIFFALISCIFFLVEKGISISGILFSLFFVLLLSVLWLVPYEVIANKDTFIVKSLLRKRKIKYSDVKKISILYSTKSMIWYGGDKNKANMVCYIWISSNPINLIVINGSITKYRELCSHLEEKVGDGRRGQT